MPLIQGPEAIWERTADPVKWTVNTSQRDQETLYELRVACGMDILRLHYFTPHEMKQLQETLAEHFRGQTPEARAGRASDLGSRAVS